MSSSCHWVQQPSFWCSMTVTPFAVVFQFLFCFTYCILICAVMHCLDRQQENLLKRTLVHEIWCYNVFIVKGISILFTFAAMY